MTDQHRLQLALTLAERDLQQMTPSALTRLRRDILEFVAGRQRRETPAAIAFRIGGGASATSEWETELITSQAIKALSPRCVRELQNDTRRILQTLGGTRDRGWVIHGGETYVPVSIGVRTRRTTQGAQSEVTASKIRDLFMFRLWLLLATEATRHIRWCLACDRLFWGLSGRHKYCRTASCRRVRKSQEWQRYLTTDQGRKARLRSLKKSYAKQGWQLGRRGGWAGRQPPLRKNPSR